MADSNVRTGLRQPRLDCHARDCAQLAGECAEFIGRGFDDQRDHRNAAIAAWKAHTRQNKVGEFGYHAIDQRTDRLAVFDDYPNEPDAFGRLAIGRDC